LTFVTPLGLIGLIAVPLIIILYIMKQKREKVVVSSHILWQKVLRDMQAATPWQKLRKNLLMFLQLLCAVLIVLAMSGFALKSGVHTSQPVIIAVDSSLSMSSTDVKPTRLDAAKKDAQKFVDELPPGTPVTVVNLNREPDVLLYGSDSENEIKSSIQSINQTKTYTDVRLAEELLLSLKNSQPDALIVLFSDMPIRVGNEEIQFSNYKKQNENIAVVRFAHAFREDGITAMSILRNQGDSDSEVSVSLYGDDSFLDSQLVTVPKNGTRTVWWSSVPLSVKTLHCVIDTEDILEADNHAYDTVFDGKPVKVLLVTRGNYFLEKIFSVIEGIEFMRTLPDELTEYKGYDLYILDGVVPDKLPEDGNVVIFNPVPNNLFAVGDWMDTPVIGPSDHVIFKHLENPGFSVGRTRIIEKPDWAETVIEYNGNPIIFEGLINSIRLLVFGFNIYETDLPIRTEFPVIVSNILSEYSPASGTRISGTVTEEPIQFMLQPGTIKANVITPDGRNIEIAPPVPPHPFIQTEEPGIYKVLQDNSMHVAESVFVVNLPDEWQAEDIKPAASEADDGEGVIIPLKENVRLFNLPLIIAALLILIIEWWYYANRRYA